LTSRVPPPLSFKVHVSPTEYVGTSNDCAETLETSVMNARAVISVRVKSSLLEGCV
jgi:hypothetical protein